MKRLAELFRQSGALQAGRGKVSGIIALALAVLCLLGVLAFHFPEYLTTPELRRQYSVEILRHIMLIALLISGGLALANIIMRRTRWLNATALLVVLVAIALGGNRVPVGDFADHTPYIGLDWLILDLLGSSLIFILIEKLFPLYKNQPVFRPDWQTDFTYFIVNHVLIGLLLLIVNFLVHRLFSWAAYAPLQQAIQSLPLVAEALLIIFVADLIQYWTHRSYHEVPWLWRFHAIHHSAKTLDWMAGSRLHLLEMITTRVAILGTLYVLGFSKGALDIYIVVVGFQAVFNHANVKLPWGWLRHVIVTPDFHHWHHSSEQAALDRNYAAHFAFLDRLFGTLVKSEQEHPQKYGVLGDEVPSGFLRQQVFPFTWKKPSE